MADAPALLDGYVSKVELADELEVSPRTISRYESEPDGLPSMLLGGRRLYRVEAVREWLRKRERRPNPRRARTA